MRPSPHLVQYLDLTPEHFSRHPVWLCVHGVDEDEPWYGDTDEETFRPWTGALPVGPEEGLLLVRASFTLADGTVLPGFLTPQAERKPGGLKRLWRSFASSPETPPTDVCELLQPVVFLPGGAREGFWDGLIDRPAATRAAFFAQLGKPASDVFPIRAEAFPGLTRGRAAGVITDL